MARVGNGIRFRLAASPACQRPRQSIDQRRVQDHCRQRRMASHTCNRSARDNGDERAPEPSGRQGRRRWTSSSGRSCRRLSRLPQRRNTGPPWAGSTGRRRHATAELPEHDDASPRAPHTHASRVPGTVVAVLPCPRTDQGRSTQRPNALAHDQGTAEHQAFPAPPLPSRNASWRRFGHGSNAWIVPKQPLAGPLRQSLRCRTPPIMH